MHHPDNALYAVKLPGYAMAGIVSSQFTLGREDSRPLTLQMEFEILFPNSSADLTQCALKISGGCFKCVGIHR